MDINKLIKQGESLKSERSSNDSVWRECYDYTYPLRGSGLQSNPMTAQSGKTKTAELYDATGTDSSRLLASTMISGMTPANAQWLELTTDDATDEENEWLSESAEIIWTNIHSANFDAEAYEANLDAVIAGWFVLYIEEDLERGGYNFQQWHLGQCYCSTTRQDIVVDTIFRYYTLSAAQAVKEFGDSVSPKIKTAYSNKPGERFEFLHVITPRENAPSGGKFSKNMPFASLNIELSEKKLIRESGYNEFPCCVPRWMRLPNSVYGIGPVYDALPDIKTLNNLKKQQLAAADLAISGMWIAEDDGVLNPRTVTVGPRKIIVANSVESMKPLLTGSDFNVSFMTEQNLQAAIRKILMADQLQPQTGPAMTATEVQYRISLVRAILGPVYGRFQAEFLSPLVERCFGLAYRAGALPDIPESLEGRNYHVRYLNPLARSQKLEDVGAIERLGNDIAGLMNLAPDVIDNIDTDEAVRVLGNSLGVPAAIMRTSNEVEVIRKKREQQQQQAQQSQAINETAQAAMGAIMKKATQ